MDATMFEGQNNYGSVIQWVTFFIGEEKYGVNVMQVQEVLRYTDIAPVPGAPTYVIGIINLRGNVVTVIDTRSRFGMERREPDDSSRIIIIEADKHIFGILVDGVAEVVELSASDIGTSPNVGNDDGSKYIQGVTSKDNHLLILVDLNKFLSDDEKAEMELF